MTSTAPFTLIGREHEQRRLAEFASTPTPHATLGIVWGRRRVGKSALLQALVREQGGFYHHAIRGTAKEGLDALAADIGEHLQYRPPVLTGWPDALEALLDLAQDRAMPVVLDEFPYILEHSPAVDSVIQALYAPENAVRNRSRARLLLCGSSISMMRNLLSGTAPLRGRSGLDLRISPFDFRVARALHGIDDLLTAVHTYAVIGGVAAYAREMVDYALPRSLDEFNDWIVSRVLAPGRPLLGEMALLLSEDPETAKARKPNLYHATLASVALGHHAWNSITSRVGIGGSSLQGILDTLLASELIARIDDPVRNHRPLYQPLDPFLRFHYAVIRRNPKLARITTDTREAWHTLIPTFRSLVLGPCFEGMAREWIMYMASETTVGGQPTHIGSTTVPATNTEAEMQIDVIAATDVSGADTPEDREINAVGEAKVGETLTIRHLRRLETARARLGARAAHAKLFLFGSAMEATLRHEAHGRSDVEIVDLERLYTGD
ncbi:AAA family ATPase [Gemmatimonas sp.]|uniref:AAA family ATPase n=1 Tax=Gemmatimonas sp. TaxID=1962908 RepID=UPI003F718E9D